MLTNTQPKLNVTNMMRHLSFKTLSAGILALCTSVSAASAGDQAKAIVNALDPKSLNELIEVARRQPDAALTNITPVSANTFRFLFIWPASNPAMTFDRVGRSFAERFAVFANQWKLLAAGFCLPSRNMSFGTATFGESEINVAYRDIEVRYTLARNAPCVGRYVSLAEVEQAVMPPTASARYGLPPAPSNRSTAPEEALKPFLNPQPAAPPQ